ncbi:hypothetical protein LSM04_004984 [Trypanosoma melophagium]|uniref:uncharacterized protein n=1 Tax=Trypanosoma melophagium TaxID=715481 RepID=UPI003519F613|nr:hypothetical protein LSM04_004984 [Trypanosoma melophagium]
MAEVNTTAAASSCSSSTNNATPAQASVNCRETNTATVIGGSGGNNRKTFIIPKLDEKQLEIKFPDNQNSGSTFVVAEGGPSNTTTEINCVPLNSNASAFVIGAGSLYANANVLVDSPPSNSAYLSLLQQQSLQYQMHQLSSAEQELYLTREMLQQCPHPVLVMVLSSLLEENPAICPFVRQRCERAAVILSQQQQAAAAMAAAAAAANNNNNSNNNNGVNSNNNNSNTNNNGNNGRYNAPWGSHTVATSSYESPRPAASYTSSASPHAGGTRKGRGNRSREEGVCSVHNSVRSMNHLQLNKQTGLHECVHGFHCLEDGGSAAVTPSNFNNSAASPSHTKISLAPSRDNHSNTNYSNGSTPAIKSNSNSNINLHGANNSINHSHGNNIHNNHSHIIITSNNNNNTNTRNHINRGSKFGSNVKSHGECGEHTVVQEERSTTLFQVLNDSADTNSGFDVLNSILQSVREIAEEEGNLDEPVR